MIVLGLLPLGGWGAAYFFKLGPLAQGGAFKWASLGVAIILGGGLVWLGSLNFALKPVQKTVQFDYTGGVQWWTVPSGVTEATFTVIGAQGGEGCSDVAGGNGGESIATIPVTPGDVMQVTVGSKGHDAMCGQGNPPTKAAGGFNGGGAGGAGFGSPDWLDDSPLAYSTHSGGGGGGASDLRLAPYGLDDRRIVAGGGGGGGGWGAGGAGGGWTHGEPGEVAPVAFGNGLGGSSGTMGGGYAGGSWPIEGDTGFVIGQDGASGKGGAGADHGDGDTAGGGGGGGWNGGGGGAGGSEINDYGGGGGGGNGHGYLAIFITGAWSGGDGYVVILFWQYVPIFS